MQFSTGRRAGWAFGFLLWWRAAHAAATPLTDPTPVPFGAIPANTVRELARRVLDSSDHHGLPFAIVDKKAAMLFVYRADGRPAGETSVLLGRTPGDRATPGVGERAQRGRLSVGDRTTPAGRFSSEPGYNLTGEPVVWIDYANALAIHRLRPGLAQERRAQRLRSPLAQDKRISAGCVVVPVRFYENVVHPVLGQGRGVVYVIPEDPATPELAPEALAQAL